MSNDIDIQLNDGLTEEQVIAKGFYIDEIMKGANNKTRYGASSVPVHSNLDEFVDRVKEVLELEQIDKKNKVILIDEHSQNNVFQNPVTGKEDILGVITYSLRKRTHGTTAATNQPNDPSRREVRPRLRAATYDDVENPTQVIFHMGQWYDNIICFDINARTNAEANEVAMWFENIMDKNKPFFAYKGIMKYYFLERENDAAVKQGDGVVHCRPMVYWVRTEKCYTITEQAINNIIVKITTT
jgi:hypothetical protein